MKIRISYCVCVICFTVFALVSSHFGYATTINVPGDYSSIQDALDAAVSGDTISVAPGTYSENNLNFNGKTVYLKSTSGPETTIIDGSSSGPVFYVVSGETRNTVIDGFTVQNGYGNETHLGGGFYINNSSPTLKNNIIKSNRADQSGSSGGGIKISTDSNPLIENNSIVDNIAWQKGGGIHIYSASADIRNNMIQSNEVIGDSQPAGGGVGGTFTQSLTINGNTIEDNSTSFAGGGISVFAGNCEIVNNIIRNNTGGNFAGGIHIETQAAHGNYNVIINNNTISNNSGLIGGGIHSFMEDTSSSVAIIDNVIIDNVSVNPLCASATDAGCGKGGGIGLYSGQGSHLVKGNRIQNNYADLYGGGLLIEMPVTFQENLIESNHARFNYGGISFVDTAQCDVLQNEFLSNYSDVYDPSLRNPGGLYVKNCDNTTISNNFFWNNSGYQASAAQIISCPSNVNVFNNTFSDNNTVALGGATVRTETDTDFVNNIFKGDLFGIRIQGTPTVTIKNNDFHLQSTALITTPAGSISSISSLNDEPYAENNISADPLFWGTNNYHLRRISPCVDAGISDSAPPVDIDGDVRPKGLKFDIGADEFTNRLNPMHRFLLMSRN